MSASAPDLERDPSTLSPIERFLHEFPPEYRPAATREFLSQFSATDLDDVVPFAWRSLWARPSQILPPGGWNLWMNRAGRGAGKTRTGAESTREMVRSDKVPQVLLVATDYDVARYIMIEGPDSGLLAVHPPSWRPTWEPSKRLLTWPNGCLGHVASAEDPESPRGFQSGWNWYEECGSWRYGSETFSNAELGLRLGVNPRAIMTTTPRPLKWLRDLAADKQTIVTTGSMLDNRANLSPKFIESIFARYAGTRLGLQEIFGQFIDDVEGALWTMTIIDADRIAVFDPEDPCGSIARGVDLADRTRLKLGPIGFTTRDLTRPWRTVVGVDPPAEKDGAEAGIIVATGPVHGRAGHDHAVILDDMSVRGTPEQWGTQVVNAARRHNASKIVVEANQGGDMVRSTIHAVDPNMPVEKLHARISKAARAEPVSALYAQGWIHHLGSFAELEDQMVTWVPGAKNQKSPDRIDALVWAVADLLEPADLSGPATVHSPFDV